MSTLALNQLYHHAALRAGGAPLSRFKSPFHMHKGAYRSYCVVALFVIKEKYKQIQMSIRTGANCAFVAC